MFFAWTLWFSAFVVSQLIPPQILRDNVLFAELFARQRVTELKTLLGSKQKAGIPICNPNALTSIQKLYGRTFPIIAFVLDGCEPNLQAKLDSSYGYCSSRRRYLRASLDLLYIIQSPSYYEKKTLDIITRLANEYVNSSPRLWANKVLVDAARPLPLGRDGVVSAPGFMDWLAIYYAESGPTTQFTLIVPDLKITKRRLDDNINTSNEVIVVDDSSPNDDLVVTGPPKKSARVDDSFFEIGESLSLPNLDIIKSTSSNIGPDLYRDFHNFPAYNPSKLSSSADQNDPLDASNLFNRDEETWFTSVDSYDSGETSPWDFELDTGMMVDSILAEGPNARGDSCSLVDHSPWDFETGIGTCVDFPKELDTDYSTREIRSSVITPSIETARVQTISSNLEHSQYTVSLSSFQYDATTIFEVNDFEQTLQIHKSPMRQTTNQEVIATRKLKNLNQIPPEGITLCEYGAIGAMERLYEKPYVIVACILDGCEPTKAGWLGTYEAYIAHRREIEYSLDNLYSIRSPSMYQLEAIRIIAELAGAEDFSSPEEWAKTRLLDALRPLVPSTKRVTEALEVIQHSRPSDEIKRSIHDSETLEATTSVSDISQTSGKYDMNTRMTQEYVKQQGTLGKSSLPRRPPTRSVANSHNSAFLSHNNQQAFLSYLSNQRTVHEQAGSVATHDDANTVGSSRVRHSEKDQDQEQADCLTYLLCKQVWGPKISKQASLKR